MILYEIEFPLSNLDPAAVEAALLATGACSITFGDGADEPVLEPKPGEIRLWSDTRVRALFQDDLTEAGSALRHLEDLSAALGAHITANARLHGVASLDWTRAWLKDWQPMRFGRRLWVIPTAAEAPSDPEAIVVRLDPGLAFGTGTHPTTALCLQFLDALPLVGRTLLDYGCGSGILGIAALRLGAARVIAVDLDPQALLATQSNALLNGVAPSIDVRHAKDDHAATANLPASDYVVANILAQPLIELEQTLRAACAVGGELLLSGLLKTQAHAVKAAYAPDFAIVREVVRDEWCCLHARRTA